MGSYAANKKWRLSHPAKRHAGKATNYRAGEGPKHHARQPWTIAECDAITASDRPTDRQLAQRIGRTVRAIQIQRSRMKASILAEGSAPSSASPSVVGESLSEHPE